MMTSKFKTRDVQKSAFSNYLKKAEECYHAAKSSLVSENWNAVAINAIHACISACDAICVFSLGKRHFGDNHNDAVLLFKTIKNTEEFNVNANRLMRILRMKNMAEYEERLVYRLEAEKILKDCERFLAFVKKNLKK